MAGCHGSHFWSQSTYQQTVTIALIWTSTQPWIKDPMWRMLSPRLTWTLTTYQTARPKVNRGPVSLHSERQHRNVSMYVCVIITASHPNKLLSFKQAGACVWATHCHNMANKSTFKRDWAHSKGNNKNKGQQKLKGGKRTTTNKVHRSNHGIKFRPANVSVSIPSKLTFSSRNQPNNKSRAD